MSDDGLADDRVSPVLMRGNKVDFTISLASQASVGPSRYALEQDTAN